MYNNRQIGAENGGKMPLASNPSGCAKLIKHLTHFRKFESSHSILNFKVVIGGWGAN